MTEGAGHLARPFHFEAWLEALELNMANVVTILNPANAVGSITVMRQVFTAAPGAEAPAPVVIATLGKGQAISAEMPIGTELVIRAAS